MGLPNGIPRFEILVAATVSSNLFSKVSAVPCTTLEISRPSAAASS